MSLQLMHPWWLALALAVAAVGSWTWRRRGASLALQLLASLPPLLLVVALAQPELRHDARPTVLVLDRSASIDPAMRRTEDAWLAQARAHACPSPCRVVAAAGSAALTPARATPATLRAGTDLEGAVRLGLASVPRDGRLIVLSDGMQTTGDVLSTAAEAGRRDVHVDVVPLVSRRRDAAVTRVALPPAVRAGDEVVMHVTIRSTVAAAARVTLRRDGQAAGAQQLRLHVGDNALPLSVQAPAAGWHDYDVQVALPGDATPENNRLSATVHVQPRPSVILASAPGQSALAAELAAHGASVAQSPASSLPTSADGYSAVDALVLDDVSASALGAARERAIVSAVHDDGLGLLVSGGPNAFSLGHYADSPLERALPVTSRVPGSQQRRNVALELVIDRSGSMLDTAGGYAKIDEARAAARAAAQFALEHHDELGVLAFDATQDRLVPFGRIDSTADADAAIAQIDTLTASGGTNIPAALSIGLRELEQSDAANRHMILLTDGQGPLGSDLSPLAARMKREHITLTTVGVGTSNDPLLGSLAHSTGGEYYQVEDASQLPSIFAHEANRAARPVQVAGSLAVAVGAPSPVVRSLSGQAVPPVLHNVIADPRPTAQQTLQVQGSGRSRDAGLSQWQYGLGRVVTWTPGLTAEWAGAWARMPRVWADAVRWAQRPVALPALAATLTPQLPRQLVVDPAAATGRALELATISGSIETTDGNDAPIRFRQVAPSRYTAPLPSLSPGVHGYAIESDSDDMSQGLLAVPYDPEYLPRPAAGNPLGALAAQTRGNVRAADDPAILG
ncbi:MAG TPA: vWA domain-containing protein, partial [Conexibacter sp.]